MTIIEKQARILNDLVLINNDRVVGYEKAIEELRNYAGTQFDPILVEKFIEMIDKYKYKF